MNTFSISETPGEPRLALNMRIEHGTLTMDLACTIQSAQIAQPAQVGALQELVAETAMAVLLERFPDLRRRIRDVPLS